MDIEFAYALAMTLPISGSVARHSRWEAGVAATLSTHMCAVDEDGALVDDDSIEVELHPLDHDGSYERLDEEDFAPHVMRETTLMGRAALIAELRSWDRILRGYGLSMRAGLPPRNASLEGPTQPEDIRSGAIAELLESPDPGPVVGRLVAGFVVDRACPHLAGARANPGPGPDYVGRPCRLARHQVVHTW